MIATALAAAVLMTGSATGYSSCDGSTTQTASGKTVRVGYVANNSLPFGTWIEMRKPRTVMGRRWFQVQDRGGAGFLVDFWSPSCAWMNSWGRRQITIRVVSRTELYRGKPYQGWYLKRGAHGAKLAWQPK